VPDFTQSRRLAWFCIVSIVVLQAYGMYLELDGMGMALGGTVIALAAISQGYTHTTNKREVS
jgi:hypothetical protein